MSDAAGEICFTLFPPSRYFDAEARALRAAGALPVVDLSYAEADARAKVLAAIPADVSIGVIIAPDLAPAELSGRSIQAVIVPVDWELDEGVDLAQFIAPFRAFPVWVEVTSRAGWERASKASPAGIILKGFEAGGVVGEESSFILLQRYEGKLPVLVRGGIGPDTAAAAVAGGAHGVVTDIQTWGALPLADDIRQAILSLQGTDAVTLRLTDRHVIRVAGKMGAKAMRTLRQAEEAMLVATVGERTPETDKIRSERAELLYRELQKISTAAFTPETGKVFAVGQEVGWAKTYAAQYNTPAAIAAEILKVMKSSPRRATEQFPWVENSAFARSVGAKLPIFQGPMAQTSDVAAFAEKVMDHGVVANLALGNMPGTVCEKLLKDTLAISRGRPFGGGIIGLEANAFFRDQHIAHMKALRPPLAVVAAGTTEQALDLTAAGIRSFLHTPVHTLLVNAMDQGHSDFILEGTEAGGHIGKLTSFVLWQSVMQALLDRPAGRAANVVLAGGFGNAKGAAMAAALCARAQAAGHTFGIQMGTAFLFTKEAVETGATSSMYQEVLVELERTETIGDTVMTPARMAPTPKLFAIRQKEYERMKSGETLDHRKHLYENDNLGGLRAAAKKQKIEKVPEGGIRFVNLTDNEQMDLGLFHVGMCAALRREITTIAEVVADNTVRARELLKARVETLSRPSAQAQPAVQIPAQSPVQNPALPPQAPAAFKGANGHNHEGIAIIGLGGMFPDAQNIPEFWRNITTGKYSIREVPEDRWATRLFYSPDRNAPDKSYSKIGGFLTEPEFDSKSFRIPPAVASTMDLAQRVSLLAVREALQDAGYYNAKPFDKTRCAVIVGNSQGGENTHRYAYRLALPMILEKLEQDPAWKSLPEAQRREITGNISRKFLGELPEITGGSMPGELPNVIAGRIASVFDLSGPNFVCDAACAASLAAVHTSVLGLLAGEYDMAITGGVDRGMDADSYIKFCKVGALSDTISAPFDKRASGFVMGEGVGILVMKRLSDAVRDGDRIYGVLSGLGASSDGAGRGITAPSPAGQRKAIERAYRMAAGLDPRTVTLVECHGTSTPLGDATETTVLKEWFTEHGATSHSVAVGSVKSQIGHLKSAAGAAGLIKILLSLHHKTLPPSINFESPAAGTGLGEGSPLFVNTKARPWNPPAGVPRRASVSAFGFGGTNFHVLCEEYTSSTPARLTVPAESRTLTAGNAAVAYAAPAEPAAPAQAAVSNLPAAPVALVNMDKATIEKIVVQTLADQTGYEAEDLGRTLDLEADLGIDTVKQAEVFAALREHYRLEKDPNLKLRDYPTIEKIVDYLAMRLSSGSSAAQPQAAAPVSETPAPQASPVSVNKSDIETVVVRTLADQTGYEAEDLGRTLDLEADLGIDTVKQAEVFAALREHYRLEKDPNLKLRDYPTIEKIVDYLAMRLSGSAATASAPAASAPPEPAVQAAAETQAGNDGPSYVVVLGHDAASLADNLETWAENPSGTRFGSGSKTAAFGFLNRNEASSRARQIAQTVRAGKRPPPALNAKLGEARTKKPRIAFVYPGQGSQYVGMLRELMVYPEVRATFEEAEAVVSPLIGRSLLAIIHPADTSEENLRRCENELKQTEITQPAVLTADIAIHRFLKARGFGPDAVAGHSLGEYGAAVAAGAMSFRDALEAVAARGREMANVKVDDNGLMLMVPMGTAEVEPLLGGIPGYIEVANRNSPQQTVVGGSSASVMALKGLLDKKGVDTVLLNVSHAFHSKIVAPASEPLRRVLGRLGIRSPEIPIYSNVTAKPYPTGASAPAEIVDLLSRQIAASVDWIGSVENMYRDGIEVFVECGPKRALAGLVEANLKGRPSVAIQTCHPKRGELLSLVEGLAHLSAELVTDDTPAPVKASRPETAAPAQWQEQPQVPAQPSLPSAAGPASAGTNPLARWMNDPRFEYFWQKNGRAVENMISHLWAVTMNEAPARTVQSEAPSVSPRRLTIAMSMPVLTDTAPLAPSDPGRNVPMQLWKAAHPIGRRVPVYVSEPKAPADTRWLDGKSVAIWSVTKQSETLSAALAARGAKLESPSPFGTPFATGCDLLVIDARANARTPDRFVPDLILRLNDLIALARSGRENLTVVGLGTHSIELDPSQAMFQAAVRGFLLTLSHEFPGWKVRWTMATALDDAGLARAIEADAASPAQVVQSRWSRFGRALLEGVPASIQGASGLKPRPDRVWLVTGGARGITREIVLDLARHMGGRFALVGSSPEPSGDVQIADEKTLRKEIRQSAKAQGLQPSAAEIETEVRARLAAAEIRDALVALKELGVEARYYSCDLSSSSNVDTLVKRVRTDLGGINVVIHGAGREMSRSTAEKTIDDIRSTFGVKLEGALFLALETRCDPLEAFVMFGSVVGRFGNTGQADYAAANGALTGLVRHFSAVGNPLARPLLIDWSAWAEVGMASRGVAKDHFRESGVDLIYPATGAPLVRAELLAGTAGEIIACGTLGELDRAGVVKPPSGGKTASSETPRKASTGNRLAVSASTEPWLSDHSIEGVAVWPGVGGIELMRQSAGFGGKPFEATEVRFERAIKIFPGKTGELEASAAGVAVQVPAPSGPQFRPHFTAGHFSIPSVKPEWTAPLELSPDAAVRAAIYQVYFHGPRFQLMTGAIQPTARDWFFGARAGDVFTGGSALRTPDATASAIEAAFQAAGLRTMIETGTSVLPSGIQWLSVHRPVRSGEQLQVNVAPVSHPSEHVCRCNVRVFDAAGNELLSLVGYDQVVTGQVKELPAALARLRDSCPAEVTPAVPVNPTTAPSARPAASRGDVFGKIMEVLCRETGYEPEDISPAADLEGDLGIDTVKQAEVFAQVRTAYGLEKDPDFKLRDYPTLNKLTDYVLSRLGGASAAPVSQPEIAPAAKIPRAEVSAPASPLPEPWARYAVIDIGSVLRELDTDPAGVLGRLSADERADYGTMTFEKRRLEWLAGRLAARQALKGFGTSSDVTVKADDSGEPRFAGPLGDKYGLTISHSNIWATAIVWERKGQLGEERHVGVDIERTGDRSEAFLEDNFSAAERAALPSNGLRSETATLIWSFKESALKALGTGLRLRPDQVSVTLDTGAATARITLSGEAGTVQQSLGLSELTGRYVRAGEYVVTAIEAPRYPGSGTKIDAGQGWTLGGFSLNAKNKS
ncbi:MAG: SDR family NAD(P)-dependent oxidoreductase [Deltaproteobacteria bacterium]|nr:SDR family NAD(P)-dependent oxidoreductase [Deltaproteobacteria bacterium]